MLKSLGGPSGSSACYTYPLLTLDDAPEIVVEIANSGAHIGGVGEIGTPGIAPAVGNAIFAATGKRLRSLPFSFG
jgi:isoquinoline 1-oxidoreductase beta subunit